MPYRPRRRNDLSHYARSLGNGQWEIGSPSVQNRMGAAESQPTQATPHGNISVTIATPRPKNEVAGTSQRRSIPLKDKPAVSPEVASKEELPPHLIPVPGDKR